jgi:hypothetical protein
MTSRLKEARWQAPALLLALVLTRKVVITILVIRLVAEVAVMRLVKALWPG